jgi:pyrimidine-nucleoside phosphorylase
MRIYDIISKKRDGEQLSRDEIYYWVNEYAKGNIPDYQISALLMAIYLRGMNRTETLDLTMAMVESGDIVDLSNIPGIKVDKHSTGGVGDKTTLILAPLVASTGLPIIKMSGRGLGHTGGTIDKLESIPGFNAQINISDFQNHINKVGVLLTGQTPNLVPADKKIYSLRDVTATVESIPLIAASIMSKKIASGSDAIVLDVKAGNGALIKDTESAFKLAEEMVSIGIGAGRTLTAVISNMNQPLGNAVGNSLEVIEAIDTLKGKGPSDLHELCIILGAHMLLLGKRVETLEKGKELLNQNIKSGQALKKLYEIILNQNGNPEILYNYNLLPKAKNKIEILSPVDGYINRIDTEKIGIASLMSGAGRTIKEEPIDPSAGIVLKKKTGSIVEKDDVLAYLYINHKENIKEIVDIITHSFFISKSVPQKEKLVLGIIK